MDQTSLLELVRSRFLNIQRLYRYMQTEQFAEACSRMRHSDIKAVKGFIEKGNLEQVRTLVKGLIQDKYDLMPVSKLRKLARQKHIKYYSELTRASLIKELIEIDTRRSEQAPSKDGASNIEKQSA